MGLVIRVHKVRRASLRDPRLLGAMSERGVTSLPALLTPTRAYEGARAISEVYAENCRAFAAWKQRQRQPGPTRARAPSTPSGLEAYYREEMGLGEDPGDSESEAMNKPPAGMLAAYRERMEARSKPGRRQTRPPQEPAAPPPSAHPRADNVGEYFGDAVSTGTAAPRGGPDSVFEALRSGQGSSGFEVRGPDSDADPTDDFMERAYYENQDDSLPTDH
jgi:hypothetical protein